MAFDPIVLLERNYASHADARAWLRSLVGDVSHALEPDGFGGMGYFLGPAGATEIETHDQSDVWRQVLVRGFELATPRELRAVAVAARRPGISSLFEVTGEIPANRDESLKVHVGDSIALLVPASDRPPAVFAKSTATYRPLTDLQRALWYRVAIHLSAGYRLVGREASPDASDVEAVVTPGGQLVDLRGVSRRPAARALLRDAALAVDRARTRQGRSDPLGALELWQGLLAGRWSLVEHFDTDGRQFLLARRNDPAVARPAGVTPRQRQVLFYASLGLSNQEIGYALGLADNTVSAHVKSGLARLGLTRAELIRIDTELVLAALPPA